jgi:predicted nucleotidyltransferase
VDKSAALEAIERFRVALEKLGIRASKVILYGSYATGNWREGSDIDVVVISGDFAGKGYWERIDLLAKAVCEVWKPIEAVAMTPEEWAAGDSMIAELARNGELVFAAEAG